MRHWESAVVLLALACGPALADWPVFRGTPEMAGVADAKLPEQLQVIWSFKTGNTIDSAPVVAGDSVYVASADKHLYALELGSGKQRWKVSLESPLKASPGVHDGRVYAGNSDGKLYALDAGTGKVLWTFETAGEITAGVNFHNGNVLLGSHDSTLYCLNPEGRKLWEFAIDGPVNGSPAVVGDRVLVAGCDSLLHAVDAATGKSLGNVDLGGQAGATAAAAGGSVYVGTMANQVLAINWKSMKKEWTFEAARRQQPFYSSAAVTDSLVILGSRDKRLYALDRATGRERWSHLADGAIDASPLVASGRVFFSCQEFEGRLIVLDLRNGKKLQTVELDSPVTGSPAAAADSILVGTETGTLYRLGAKREGP